MSRQVTVVVPAHGGESALLELLRVLNEQAAADPLPVVIADDASKVPLRASIADDRFPALRLELLRTESSLGPGGARNSGLERVTTPWVAFLDSDELPGEGWLDRLTRLAERDDPPDLVEGRVVTGDGPPPTPFTHIAEASAAGGEHVGGNILLRTEALRDAGGFSERFFDPARKLHFREDLELYFRLASLGLRLERDDELVVLHPPRAASFWDPIKDARRYYFDPLLAREHPERFASFVRLRKLGPVPLRRARHVAAQAHGISAVALVAAAATRVPAAVVGAGALFAGAWAANGAALVFGRHVAVRHLPQVAAASFLIPWVYLWSYYRGCVRFRTLPRL